MITAVFYKKGVIYSGFKVSGHAEYAEYGQDIVCASVSSAVQLTANLITEVFSLKSDVMVDGDAVTLEVAEVCKEAGLLIDGLRMHLELLSEEFENTIITKISEV
jgi:uncharacterized protein YsxB (DUF464 family)